jgi:hypothetical protein
MEAVDEIEPRATADDEGREGMSPSEIFDGHAYFTAMVAIIFDVSSKASRASSIASTDAHAIEHGERVVPAREELGGRAAVDVVTGGFDRVDSSTSSGWMPRSLDILRRHSADGPAVARARWSSRSIISRQPGNRLGDVVQPDEVGPRSHVVDCVVELFGQRMMSSRSNGVTITTSSVGGSLD